MSSNTTFTIDEMNFYLDYSQDDNTINISSDGWGDPEFEDPDDMGYGWWFPVSVEKKEILWNSFPLNVDSIPEEVRRTADAWIRGLEL